MTSDLKLWVIALWVENRHPEDGLDYIADQIAQMSDKHDREGVDIWLRVAERFEALNARESMRCGTTRN